MEERAKAKERVKQQKIDAAAEQKKFKEQQREKLKEIRAQMKVRANTRLIFAVVLDAYFRNFD